MDNKMTDDEIKKAALNCSSGSRCDDCLYDERGCRGLVTDLLKINNRKQAEIERLEKILDKRCDKCPAATTAIAELAVKVKDIFSPEDEVRQDIDNIAQEMARLYRK